MENENENEKEEWRQEAEINDMDLEEIAKQIKEGYTSGRLDSKEEIEAIGSPTPNDTKTITKYIYYELKICSWYDD